MDCFYAAVEMRERPELREVPIAVGGGSSRGVVTTCNYLAREYGVRSAMPGFMALQLCPTLVFVPTQFELYREASAKVREIMHRYTDLVEPLSLDEAYLDVTASGRYAWDIAKELRAAIHAETELTGSAGVAANKMLAKIASDWRKPNGQFAILPENVEEFMRALPVGRIWGVGPKAKAKLEAQGVRLCGDLQAWTMAELVGRFGRWGEELYSLCRGQDDREVRPHRPRKSMSNERTFSRNLTTLAECEEALDDLIDELFNDLAEKAGERAIRTAVVKVKFADFTRTTRECGCVEPRRDVFLSLLGEAWARQPLPVRLLGAGVRFVDEDEEEEADDGGQLEFL
jgi:DNA polymerase-4